MSNAVTVRCSRAYVYTRAPDPRSLVEAKKSCEILNNATRLRLPADGKYDEIEIGEWVLWRCSACDH